jgi:hypothetical protein
MWIGLGKKKRNYANCVGLIRLLEVEWKHLERWVVSTIFEHLESPYKWLDRCITKQQACMHLYKNNYD